jgi:hypothetical protein
LQEFFKKHFLHGSGFQCPAQALHRLRSQVVFFVLAVDEQHRDAVFRNPPVVEQATGSDLYCWFR